MTLTCIDYRPISFAMRTCKLILFYNCDFFYGTLSTCPLIHDCITRYRIYNGRVKLKLKKLHIKSAVGKV